MKVITLAFYRSWPLVPTRLTTFRSVMTVPDQDESQQPLLDRHYGSVRQSWRGYLHQLGAFPKLQQVVLQAASVLTPARELEFHLPRDFHVKYEVGEILGQGAFGTVSCCVPVLHEVRHELQLELAVKTVPKAHIASQQDYVAVNQEGHMMKLLGGTLNAVHLYGAYEDEVNVYFVMERCVGGNAATRLFGAKGMLEEQAKTYMREILQVIWQCHLLGILHRDVKLDNFLFADTRHDSPLKLTDFGRAAFLDQGDFLTEVHGTPLYTAPEVLEHHYAFPSDLWSCGVILYRLLSGRYPFEAGQLLDERIMYQEIDLESSTWTGISGEAKDLVHQLLERDVSIRVTAAQALKHPWLGPSRPLSIEASSTASAAAKEAIKGIAGPLLSGTLVQRLQLYRSLTNLQRAVLIEVTRLLPLGYKQDVMVLYSEVSRDGSELVGLDEFAVYVAAGGYRLTKDEAKGFLRNLDLDGDGLLSRDEFCAALLDWPLLQSQHRQVFTKCAHEVFDMVDWDQDGRLAVEDVAKLTSFQEHGKYLHSYQNDLSRCFQDAARSSRDSMDKEDFKHMLRVPADAYVHFPKRLKLEQTCK